MLGEVKDKGADLPGEAVQPEDAPADNPGMDVAGTHVVHGRPPRRRVPPVISVAAVSSLAVTGVWIGMWRAAVPMGQFEGLCERLRAAHLPIVGRDWFCLPASSGARAASTAATILMVVGIGLACSVLAAGGRRFTALVPLAGLLAVERAPSVMQTWSIPPFLDRPIARVGLDLALVAAPALAVMWVGRHRPARKTAVRPLAGFVAFAVCVAAAACVTFAWNAVLARHFAAIGGIPFTRWQVLPAAFVMGAFGMLLGPDDRRWWPWILVATAFLLSAAPSMALLFAEDRFPTYASFGLVVPLALVGLVGSAWRPIADLIVAKGLIGEPAEGEAPPPAKITTPMRDLPRGAILADVLAAGLVVVSLILFAADPLAAEIEATIPTYVGVRYQAHDVRAKMDLREAVDAAFAYRSRTGTFRGFDARTGARSDPALAWMDGPLAAGTRPAPALTMAVASTTGSAAHITALSGSGRVFCIRATADDRVTWGEGGVAGVVGTAQVRSAEREALAHCGETLWTAAAVATTPLGGSCAVASDSDYVMCRAVEAEIVRILATAKPA